MMDDIMLAAIPALFFVSGLAFILAGVVGLARRRVLLFDRGRGEIGFDARAWTWRVRATYPYTAAKLELHRCVPLTGAYAWGGYYVLFAKLPDCNAILGWKSRRSAAEELAVGVAAKLRLPWSWSEEVVYTLF